MEHANTAQHSPERASNSKRGNMSKSNDPYGVDLVPGRNDVFKTHRKMPNRFKALKKQNIENKRLEAE